MQYIRDLVVRIRNKYISNIRKKTPVIDGATYTSRNQWLSPVLIGRETIESIILDKKNILDVLDLLKKLPNDNYLDFLTGYYSKGLKLFGNHWKYADITTTLNAISKNIKIESYLEIGVRTGRSMAAVAAHSKECSIVGFDLWIQDYAGMDNPGPENVISLLKEIGHTGDVDLISGNSLNTVPQYFNDNVDKYFDLITVDGDHRIKGAKKDIRNVMPHLKIGGFLVFDDIISPHHPYLMDLWKKEIKSNPRYETYEFKSVGLGVGVAVRKY